MLFLCLSGVFFGFCFIFFLLFILILGLCHKLFMLFFIPSIFSFHCLCVKSIAITFAFFGSLLKHVRLVFIECHLYLLLGVK